MDAALAYARSRDYSGIDPYDALRSPVFASLHRVAGRRAGILATQVLRRLPFDIRPLVGITPAVNSKGLALFLASAARTGHVRDVRALADRLLAAATHPTNAVAWGYPFPWQARAFYLPAGTPTVVATSFAGEALVGAWETTGEQRYLDAAVQSCAFLDLLHRTEDASGVCLSYSPLDRTAVYNASVLGARLLVRVGLATGNRELVERARPLVTYVLARQRVDGAWAYGEAHHHRWIDSFHTGFILGALNLWRRATDDLAAKSAVDLGFRFYSEQFFGRDGEPYYFADHRWPYDIHSASQGVVTACELWECQPDAKALAKRIGGFLVSRFLASDGHFIYQIRRTHRVTIPYMRWSQAWGVRALAELVATGIER